MAAEEVQPDVAPETFTYIAECDRDVYKKGKVIFYGEVPSAKWAEVWVQKIKGRSGQNVDWHYMGGICVVKSLGSDLGAAVEAIKHFLPDYCIARWDHKKYNPYGKDEDDWLQRAVACEYELPFTTEEEKKVVRDMYVTDGIIVFGGQIDDLYKRSNE